MHRLLSTAVPQPPAPIVERDPYAEGYAEGYAAALRERAAVVAWLRAAPAARLWRQEPMDAAAGILERGQHIADLADLTPNPTPTE